MSWLMCFGLAIFVQTMSAKNQIIYYIGMLIVCVWGLILIYQAGMMGGVGEAFARIIIEIFTLFGRILGVV